MKWTAGSNTVTNRAPLHTSLHVLVLNVREQLLMATHTSHSRREQIQNPEIMPDGRANLELLPVAKVHYTPHLAQHYHYYHRHRHHPEHTSPTFPTGSHLARMGGECPQPTRRTQVADGDLRRAAAQA